MKARRRIQDEDDDQEEIYKDDRVHEEKNDDESKVDNIAPLPPRKTYDLISPPKASSIISASSSSITAPGRDYKSFFGAATKSKTIVANKRRTAPKIDDTERTLNLHKFLLENGVLLNFGDDDTENLQKLVEKFYKPAFSNHYPDMTYRDAITRVEDVCHKRHMHDRLTIIQEEWTKLNFGDKEENDDEDNDMFVLHKLY